MKISELTSFLRSACAKLVTLAHVLTFSCANFSVLSFFRKQSKKLIRDLFFARNLANESNLGRIFEILKLDVPVETAA